MTRPVHATSVPAAPEPGRQGRSVEKAESHDLSPRYLPGEDIAPLLRSVGGGLLGGVLALIVDRVIPTPEPATWNLAWPALWADALLGDPGDMRAGVAIVLTAGVLGALAFTYGQYRRFVPATTVVAGALWGALLWLLAGSVLLPQSVSWLRLLDPHSAPEPALATALLLVAETALATVLWGAVVGALNPARDG